MVFFGLTFFASFLAKILRMWRRRGSGGSGSDEFHRKKIDRKKSWCSITTRKKNVATFVHLPLKPEDEERKEKFTSDESVGGSLQEERRGFLDLRRINLLL